MTQMNDMLRRIHDRTMDEIECLLDVKEWNINHVKAFKDLMKVYSNLLGIQKWYSNEEKEEETK